MSFISDGVLLNSWGGGTSNSYVTLTSANSIAAMTMDYSFWQKQDDQLKVAALLQATRDIDSRPWKGAKLNYDQNLAFPLTNGRPFPYNRIDSGDLTIDEQRQADRVPVAQVMQAIHRMKIKDDPDLIEASNKGVQNISGSGGNASNNVSLTGTGNILHNEVRGVLAEWLGMPKLTRG